MFVPFWEIGRVCTFLSRRVRTLESLSNDEIVHILIREAKTAFRVLLSYKEKKDLKYQEPKINYEENSVTDKNVTE